LGRAHREQRRDRRHRGAGADRAQEVAAHLVVREQPAHHRRFDDARHARILVLHVGFVVGLAVVAAAAAACTVQLGIGIKRVVKAGHNVLLIGLKNDIAVTGHCAPFVRPVPRIGAGQGVRLPGLLSLKPRCIKGFGKGFDARVSVSTCVVFRKRANPKKIF
jgi:hypothetical protein